MYRYGAHYYESRFFTGHTTEEAVGEITPLYMLYDDVPARIYETLGADVKLIFCFRNPAKRAFSNYLQNVRMTWESVRSLAEYLHLLNPSLNPAVLNYYGHFTN